MIEKLVKFAGTTIGTASTFRDARETAAAAGLNITSAHPHRGPFVIVEGPHEFRIEANAHRG